MQSLAKAAISAAQSVSILAHPQSNTLHSDSDGLFDPKLLASFREGAAVLRSRNLNPSLALESDNIKHTVLRMKLLYGPPSPDSGDLVEQKWSRAVRVLVPQREAVFQSTDQQARLLKAAMEQGWVLEADVRVAGKFRCRVEGAGVDDTRRAVIFSLRSAHSHSHAWAADRHVATRAWRVEGIDT
ncbi:hypothetical protein HDU82_000592 [Entophlyctis luteolus]|nr:hypothetical protein HDU82_000592 [Entophlyctis luteolus]